MKTAIDRAELKRLLDVAPMTPENIGNVYRAIPALLAELEAAEVERRNSSKVLNDLRKQNDVWWVRLDDLRRLVGVSDSGEIFSIVEKMIAAIAAKDAEIERLKAVPSEHEVERAAAAYLASDTDGGCHMDWMRAALEAASRARSALSEAPGAAPQPGMISADRACEIIGALIEDAAVSAEYGESRIVSLWQGNIEEAINTIRMEAPGTGWLPIDENTPRTGADMIAKPFLGWYPDPSAPDGGDQSVTWWEPRLKGGIWYKDGDLEAHPTLWRPLPAPPAITEGK